MPDTGDRRLTRRDALAGTAAGPAGAPALLRPEPGRLGMAVLLAFAGVA